MSAAREQIVKEFSEITPGVPLSHLRYEARTMELIYLLFEKLTNRPNNNEISVNRADADKLYEVRSMILQDLSITPNLPQLSQKIAMSPTKMKMLFRQIFGDSIYNYFQTARMNEASRLLKDHSVSETAYQLGFSNLSHFSRLFAKYFKLRPKQYKGRSAHTSPIRRQQING
jgi:AraC-like DNA-binding protein